MADFATKRRAFEMRLTKAAGSDGTFAGYASVWGVTDFIARSSPKAPSSKASPIPRRRLGSSRSCGSTAAMSRSASGTR